MLTLCSRWLCGESRAAFLTKEKTKVVQREEMSKDHCAKRRDEVTIVGPTEAEAKIKAGGDLPQSPP